MREKRPRISTTKKFMERLENDVTDTYSTQPQEINEDDDRPKMKLPDIEFDEVWQTEPYELTKMTDYQLDQDVKSLESGSDRQENTEDLNDIYSSIVLDDAH